MRPLVVMKTHILIIWGGREKCTFKKGGGESIFDVDERNFKKLKLVLSVIGNPQKWLVVPSLQKNHTESKSRERFKS